MNTFTNTITTLIKSRVFGILLLLMPLSALAQFPLDLRVTVARPYPVRFSEYTDFETRIFIDVVNNTSNTYEIILTGNLINEERGVRIETDPNSLPNTCISIGPGTTQLTGEDLEELFNPDNLRISGASFDQIRGDQALPEGTYTLCLRAFDCDIPGKALSVQPEMFMGCFDYEVLFANPPEIEFPDCGTLVSEDQPNLPINWSFAPPDAGYGDIEFKLRIVEIDPPGRDENSVMNTATSPFLFEEDGILGHMYNLEIADFLFEPGKSYAFQVIAYDPSNIVQFRNNGASVACYFSYVESTESGELEFKPIYPQEGDYIPFDFFPIVLKFEPYSHDYILFEGDLTLSEKNDGSLREVDEKNSRNSWPSGPLYTQRELAWSEMEQDQSQHLPVYKNNQSEAHDFTRGGEYAWEFTGEMEMRNGEVKQASMPPVNFHVGMSPPRLRLPRNGTTIPTGNVTLQWQSSDKPTRLVPPYAISQVSGRDQLIYLFNGAIDEHWVLEVSKNEDFENILFTREERIDGLELTTNESEISDALYKTITIDTTLTEEGIYYWRVKWLSDPGGDTDSEHQSISPTWNFKISNDPTDSEEPRGPCISGCDAPEITNRTAVTSLSEGATIKIGMFDMEVTEVSSNDGDRFTGEGEVQVTFLNLKVLVEFESIRINTDNQVIDGEVKAKEDREFPFSTTVNDGTTALGMSQSAAEELDEYLAIGERLVSGFTGIRAIGLPIGIDKEIEGRQFTIAVLGMTFAPERAALNAVANIDLNLLDETHFFSAGIADFCFSPDGFGREGIAYLPTDHTFETRNGAMFTFKGLEDVEDLTDSASYSYFNWNCNGFKCLNLAAEHKFARDIMVPDTEDGTPGDGHVVARMNFRACRGANLMARIDMDPFQFPVDALEGYAFVVDEAWLDCSDLENPPEFRDNLPRNYSHPILNHENARVQKTWTGFWLKQLHMRTPGYIGNANRERISAGVSNMIKDASGFTASFSIDNLITWEEDGHVEGFAFSIDRFFVDIVQSEFAQAGLSGKFGIPISGEREYLEYTAALDQTTGNPAFKFVVSPKDNLEFEAWIANVNIEPTSTFEIRLGRNNNFIGVDLNGSVSISSNNQPGEGEEGRNGALDLNMPGISVEHLRFNSVRGFDDSQFTYSLASPQKNMSGFPIGLKALRLGLSGTNPTLTIVPTLTLAGDNSGFAADATITLEAAIVERSNGKKRVKLRDIDLEAIRLEVQTSAIELEGYLEFYKEASAKGVRGQLDVKLPAGIGAKFQAEFGVYKSESNPTASFNTRDHFSYWRVEGMVTFGSSGLDLFPPSLVLYGIGGGVYHHMRPGSALPSIDQVMADGSSDGTVSSNVEYVPHYETRLGLKFMALCGSTGQGKAYNFDVTLEATFSRNYGMTYMGFKGNARVFAKGVPSTDESPIMGYVAIEYSNPPEGEKVVTGTILITVDIADILTGVGTMDPVPAGYTGPTNNVFVQADFKASEGEWHFYMGKPENPSGLQLQIPGLDISLMTLQSYLMVGHGIDPDLPSPSATFLEIFYGTNDERFKPDNSSQLGELVSGALSRGVIAESSYNNARGFAFGSNFETRLSLNPRPFYFDIRMVMGFDVNVTKDLERTCAESGIAPGVNGWYAKGQFYMAVAGGFGIRVRLFRRRRSIPIFEMGAGMLLVGGIPDPAWAEGSARIRFRVLGGLIKGHFGFKVNIGEKCTTQSGSPLDNIQVIQDLQPDEASDVSVFTNLSATFAIPVNEVLEIPRDPEPDGTVLPPQRIMPFIESWTLSEASSGIEVPCRDFTFEEENTLADMETTIILKGNTAYNKRITLKAREFFPNGTDGLIDWEEFRDASFTTGEAPDHIVDENVVFTYPFKNQNYFLKEETQGNLGYVQMNRADPNNFNTYGSEFNEHVYIARFFKLGTQESTDVPIQLMNAGTTVAFDISQLENNTYYTVQLLKILVEQEADIIGSVGRDDLTENENVANATERFSETLQNLVSEEIGEVNLTKRKLPGPTTRNPREHVLYYYYFKTDQYDRFEDKAQAINIDKTYRRIVNNETFTLAFGENISMEWLDGRGFNNTYGTKIFDPLVDIQIKTLGGEFSTNSYPVNYYYRDKVQPYINAPYANLNAIINRHHLPDFTLPYMMDYDDYIWFTYDSPFRGPLVEAELDQANNPPEETSTSSGGPLASVLPGSGFSLPGPSLPIGVELPVIKVSHALSIPGYNNFARFKSYLGGYLSRQLSVRILDVVANRHPYNDPDHFYNRYKAEEGQDFQLTDEKVLNYLLEFHGAQYGELLALLLFVPNDRMLYPETSYNPNLHSFILQYRFPAPNRIPQLLEGTHKRITFRHNVD